MTRVRVQTPSRLHFGLLGWGSHAARQFGGVGLMVEKPGVEIVVEPADHWVATGPLGERSLEVAMGIARRFEAQGVQIGPCRITNLSLPEAHVGLGVGTQLSLAVARALTELAGRHQQPVETLAQLTGRGRRSGIGIHGFAEGGLIVDAGRRRENDLPTKLMRLEFPRNWSILMIVPEQSSGMHGEEEIKAFRSLSSMPETLSDQLCRLLLLGLLPAVIETDLQSFGSSLKEIQQIVGKPFAPGAGRVASPAIERSTPVAGETSMTRLGTFKASVKVPGGRPSMASATATKNGRK